MIGPFVKDADGEFKRSACAGCAKNSWYYHPENEGEPYRVSCSCRGDVRPKADCIDFEPKGLFVRFQRWLGIFSFDHRAGFRCYDISREDFFWWIFYTVVISFLVGGAGGLAIGYARGCRDLDYNYIESPDDQKIYYFEKEDYDWVMPFIYRRAIFMEDEAAHTTIKLAPLRFEDQK